MTSYVSLIVNVFHADETPLSLAKKVKALLEMELNCEPDWPLPLEVEVEVDEHTEYCSPEFCGHIKEDTAPAGSPNPDSPDRP